MVKNMKTHQDNLLSENEFNILYLLRNIGNNHPINLRFISKETKISLGTVSSIIKELKEKKLIDNDTCITAQGLESLIPYKVDNAIIMAAGTSSRFVPLSYDQPKALLSVKGEILIEREIRQLKEAGINNIIVVLGYKKEMLFYLEDKYNVRLIINPYYLEKNNIETLWLAKDYLRNSYICCSDQYFTNNPFKDHVFTSYYDCNQTLVKKKGFFITKGSHNSITKATRTIKTGWYFCGEAYWNREFSLSFIKLIEEHNERGDYDSNYWEKLYSDNISKLPKLHAKTDLINNVHEFNSLDELREFDQNYVEKTDSKILNNISMYFHCQQSDITDFKTIKKGLTNTSFSFLINGVRYVYRHPGEGANEIVNRYHEESCLKIAKEHNIDPSFITMDANEGWKISKFIFDFHEPDYHNPQDCTKVLNMLRHLHSLNIKVDWEFKPWEESLELEKEIEKLSPIRMAGFQELKNNISLIYNNIKKDNIKKCFCHCDTYSPNWMLEKDKTYLIDWEYGGMSDPGVDVGYFMIDGEYTIKQAKEFIEEYCLDSFNDKMFYHYLGWAAIVSYYWFVWALFKESRGVVMGEALHRWYKMSRKYSNYLLSDTSK